MLKLFLDTEFTSIAPDTKLISVGIIDEHSERTFYSELTDNYTIEDCSNFVIYGVLPLLDAPLLPQHVDYRNIYARMTQQECRQHLSTWIASHQEPVQFVSDAPDFDVLLMRRLFYGHPWPMLLDREAEKLPLENAFWKFYGEMSVELFKREGCRRHHALDDAKVMREVMLKLKAQGF